MKTLIRIAIAALSLNLGGAFAGPPLKDTTLKGTTTVPSGATLNVSAGTFVEPSSFTLGWAKIGSVPADLTEFVSHGSWSGSKLVLDDRFEAKGVDVLASHLSNTIFNVEAPSGFSGKIIRAGITGIGELMSLTEDKFTVDTESEINGGLDVNGPTNLTGGAVTVDNGYPLIIGAGGGALTSKVGGNLISYLTQTGNVGSGEDTLGTLALPGDTLQSAGDSVVVEAHGSWANNANAKTLAVKFEGAYALTTSLPTSVAGSWVLRARISRTGVNTQISSGTLLTSAAALPLVVTTGSLTEDLSATVNVKVVGEGVSNNDVVLKGFFVEWRPAP